MSKLLVPHAYQQLGQQFLVDTPRCNLWAGMGMGKCVMSILALDTLRIAGMSEGPALVIGPLRVARDTWPEEVLKWEQYKHWKVSAVVGTESQRRAALRVKADIYTVNYEQLPWLVKLLGASWPFRVVIADESTRLKGYRIKQGGQRVHAVGEIAHRLIDRWINLSGTPAPNGLGDLWGQAWFLDRGERLGRSFKAFEDRWFKRNYSGYGLRPVGCADEEIKSRMRDLSLTLDPKDYFDLKEPIVKEVTVELPAAARKAYDELEAEFFTQVGGHDIEVFNSAALSQKCLQAASGAVYVKRGSQEYATLHDEKLDALESIVEEAGGMPVLVSHWFDSARDRILKRFKGSVNLSTVDGMKAFKKGHARIGLGHPGSIGHGYDGLQHVTNIMANFDHTWDSELSRQIYERIGAVRQAQAGYERPVWVYNIVAARTLDSVVIARNQGKVTVEDSLRAYMIRRAA